MGLYQRYKYSLMVTNRNNFMEEINIIDNDSL